MASNTPPLLLVILVFISCQLRHTASLRTTTFLKVTSGSSSSGALGLYHAPPVYGKGVRPLRSYIITSRPLTFSKRPLTLDTTGSGGATISCKGMSCAPSAPTAPTTENPGFSGEAIPLPDEDINTLTTSENGDPKRNPGTGTSGSTPVILDVERPYIKRKQTSVTTTTQRPLRRQRVTTTATTTTTAKPPSTRRPFGIGSLFRPWTANSVFPAVAAFTLVALPLAAVAAAPLFVSSGRRRRKRDVVDEQQEKDMEDLLGQLEFWMMLDEGRYEALDQVQSSEDLGKMMAEAKDAAKVLRPIWSGNIFRRKTPNRKQEIEGIL